LLNRRPTPRVTPLVSDLRLCRRCPSGLPRTSYTFSVAGFREVPGFPSSSRLLLQRLRYSSQVAPRTVPPALPVIDRRVTSILASFGGAGCASSGLPRFLYPRYRRRSVSGLPRMLILRHRLHTVRVSSAQVPSGSPWSILQVALGLLPWLRCRDQFPGHPKSWVRHRSPILFPSSRPEVLFLG